jgi:peptidoglycan/xylan/chitin deacetylase (PgdA/CDA1 family)
MSGRRVGGPMSGRGAGGAKAAARRALRRGAVGAAVRALAALRGRSLALVYHRVDAERRPPGVVPAVPASLFRRHVEALADVGDVVDLERLLDDGGRGVRPRFALTFDDDLPTHADQVLPSLSAAGLVAAFFLSGRALLGLGAYWFESLDALVGAEGPAGAARRLGIEAADLGELALACEEDRAARERLVEAAPDGARQLDAGSIRALAEAGMTIGFHTVEHAVLPALDDDQLRDALSRGRPELEAAAGRPLRHFAYPHGRTDARVSRAVADAGFSTAWTGRPVAVGRRPDPMQLGRWEPGPIEVDELLVGLAVRLHSGGRS